MGFVKRATRNGSSTDLRGVLALVVVAGAFIHGLLLVALRPGHEDIPDWMIAIVFMVVGHFFGAREGDKRSEAYETVVGELRARVDDQARKR